MSDEKSEKTQYEDAVEEFKAADQAYLTSQERMLSGQLVVDLLEMTRDPNQLMQQWQIYRDQLRKLLEDRNAKLTAAKNALRQAVILGPTQWRGPDGKSTSIAFEQFSCSSVTKRTYDAKSLIEGTARHGLQERLLQLEGKDKDGRPYKLVQQVWEVDYQGVTNWLDAHKLDDVKDGAYDEKEGTPQVKGPKPLTFLGDERKD